MKLVEALNIVTATRGTGHVLSCNGTESSSPEHVPGAELSLLFDDRKIELRHGLNGDLLGDINRLAKSDADAHHIARMGRLGRASRRSKLFPMSPAVCADIVATVKSRTSQVQQAIDTASARMVVIFEDGPQPSFARILGRFTRSGA